MKMQENLERWNIERKIEYLTIYNITLKTNRIANESRYEYKSGDKRECK